MATKEKIGTKKTKTAKPKKKTKRAKGSEPQRVYMRLDFSALEAFRQSINAFTEAPNGEPLPDDMTEEEWQAEWKESTRKLKSQKSRKTRKTKK